MMKTTDIKNKWQEFRNQRGYLQRLDPNHPLDFFIGINANGKEELVLITITEPAQMKSSKSLEIEKGTRKDGKWATQISSIESENQDIFARLCIDLVESSQNAKSEAEGLSSVVKRFMAWQRLFASLNNDLPISVLKGLVGELIFASEILSNKYSWDEIMEAWQGPDGADRDYVFMDRWFELKAISTGKDKLSISSLNQLETDTKGFIVKYNVDESSCTDPKAASVNDYVRAIRDCLQNAPKALQSLERKLVSLGYVDKKTYDDIYFIHSRPDFYEVDETFPKLITENVPKQIVGVRYDLSLVGIEPWKAGENQIWN